MKLKIMSLMILAMFVAGFVSAQSACLKPKNPRDLVASGNIVTTRLSEDSFGSYEIAKLPEFVKHYRSQSSSSNPNVFMMAAGYSDLAPISGTFACFDFLDQYYKKGSQIYLMFVVANFESTAQTVNLSLDCTGTSKNIKWKGNRSVPARTVLLLYLKKPLAVEPSMYMLIAKVGKPLPSNMIDFATSKFVISSTY